MRWKQFLTPVQSMDTESAQQLVTEKKPSEINILDVRQPGEYEAGHIPGSKLMPVGDLGKLALATKCPIAVRGNGLEEVASLTTKLTEMKIKDIVVDTGARKLNQAFQDHIELRRAALYLPTGVSVSRQPVRLLFRSQKQTFSHRS